MKVANFKNIKITSSSLKKILTTMMNEHQNVNWLNFRKVSFNCDVFDIFSEYFKKPRQNPLTIDLR